MASLEEKKLSGETVFKGHLLDVRRDVVELPDGKEAKREYIVHQGAVVVLPVLEDGRICLVRQFRYALGREILELPAGKIDPGEELLETAKRELLEEIGGTSACWSDKGVMLPCVGYSSERIGMFVAKDVVLGPRAEIDEDEFIDIVKMTPEEVFAAMESGLIDDGKSMLLLHMSAPQFGWNGFEKKKGCGGNCGCRK